MTFSLYDYCWLPAGRSLFSGIAVFIIDWIYPRSSEWFRRPQLDRGFSPGFRLI
jgi:hypothetical protein